MKPDEWLPVHEDETTLVLESTSGHHEVASDRGMTVVDLRKILDLLPDDSEWFDVSRAGIGPGGETACLSMLFVPAPRVEAFDWPPVTIP